MAVMSTLMGWATCIAVALYFIHRSSPQHFRRLVQRLQPPTPTSAPAQPKKRKEKEKGPEPSRKRKIVSAPVEPVQATTIKGQTTSHPRDNDGDMGDREFARQLAAAQKGTQLQSKSGPVKERRTVKTGKAQESPSLSAGEADDDMSPVNSPTRPAGDVSDMLEPAPAKPTTLNITSIPESKPKQQSKQTKPEQLTKKQRQRQAQKEENQRVQAAAAETEKKLREQQIRGARMAEGTSNQTKADKFQSNAWKQQTPALPQPTSNTPAPLLDTFEPTSAPSTSISNTNDENVRPVYKNDMPPPPKPNTNGTSNRPILSHQSSWADEVNEEAQEQYAQQVIEDAQWQEVTTKKSKKANKNVNDTSSEASANTNAAQTNAGQGVGTKANGSATASTGGVNGSAAVKTVSASAPRQQLNRFESIGDDSLDGW
jgi:hypothetical protein